MTQTRFFFESSFMEASASLEICFSQSQWQLSPYSCVLSDWNDPYPNTAWCDRWSQKKNTCSPDMWYSYSTVQNFVQFTFVEKLGMSCSNWFEFYRHFLLGKTKNVLVVRNGGWCVGVAGVVFVVGSVCGAGGTSTAAPKRVEWCWKLWNVSQERPISW